MRVLIACEESGTVRDLFAAKGHDAWSCDLKPSRTDGNHYQGSVFDILNDEWDLMIAHPPCTRLTVTGNRWYKMEYRDRFPTIIQDREDAVEFFMKLANAPIHRICIENPVGIMSKRWRKADQLITTIGYKEEKFESGKTDDDTRFGCLPYGIIKTLNRKP